MEYFIDDTLRLLSSVKQADIHYFLSEGRKKGALSRRGTPFFFYQSGLFSSPYRKGREGLPPDREYYTKCKKSEELTPLHLSLLEYIFGISEHLSTKQHKLVGTVRLSAIENIIFGFSSTGRSKARAEVVFKKLFSALISIYCIDDEGETLTKTFPLFDFLRYDENTMSYEYGFSDMCSFLYAVEPLVSYNAIKTIHGEGFPSSVSYIVNYATTVNKDFKHLSISNLVNALDYLPEGKESRGELLNGISDFLCFKEKRKFLKSSYGIKVDVEMPRGKEVFVLPLRRSARPIIEQEANTLSFIRILNEGGDYEEYEMLTSKDQDPIEDEIERRVDERVEEEVANILAKRKAMYIDFADLNVRTYSIILDVATEYGFSETEATVMLAKYCEWHQDKDVQQSRDRFITKWKEWVENSSTYARDKIEPRKRKVDAPNKGDAKNIILNDEMKKVLEKHSVSNIDGIEYFTKFRNYYLSVGGYINDWIPRFENWVMDSKKRASEDTLKKGNLVIENNFYYARIISEEVKTFIRNNGYDISDVVSGKIEFEDVVFRSFPVPSKYGKGNEILFSFKDGAMNDEILKQYITPRNIDSTGKTSLVL